jgi:hypothetical protein
MSIHDSLWVLYSSDHNVLSWAFSLFESIHITFSTFALPLVSRPHTKHSAIAIVWLCDRALSTGVQVILALIKGSEWL